MSRFYQLTYATLTTAILVLLFISACIKPDPDPSTPPDEKSSPDHNTTQPQDNIPKIVGGRLSAAVPWVVGLRIHVPNSNGSYICTGSVLSNKWILTAGHCFDDFSSGQWISKVDVLYAPNPGERSEIYSGPGVFKKHRDRDIALLFLYRIGGLESNYSLTGQANIFFDNREPWVNPRLQEDRAFSVLGWGSTRGGTWSCDEGSTLNKRLLAPLFINEGGSHGTVTVHRGNEEKMCGGDSGAPWILDRSGIDMAFAVYYQTDLWVFPPSPVDRATLIRPLLGWFGSASKSVHSSHMLEPTEHVGNGWHYLTFQEVDTSPPAPCPNGQSCCYFTNAGSCAQCVSPGETCRNNPWRGCGPNQVCGEPGVGPDEGCRRCIPKWADGPL